MDEGDINELIKKHSIEVTADELKELLTQQHTKVLQEKGDAEEAISTSEIKEISFKRNTQKSCDGAGDGAI